ncbi:PREDICTED: uncharacterized protein LOC106302743 [Brassica oleracea var. oleracea]|nr:PREDICTED: uncharacterized protein LOC106302743 [Brassica oleracea var. oleracea]
MRELVTFLQHELWFVFARRPLRFSLQEFHAVTGFECDTHISLEEFEEWKYDGGFWSKVLRRKDGTITLFNLWTKDKEAVKKWRNAYRVRLVYLAIILCVVLARDEKANIPLKYIAVVMDLDRVRRYPWGVAAYDLLCKSIAKNRSQLKEKTTSYVLDGFSYALQIWAMEAVPKIGKLCGKKLDKGFKDGPRCINWMGAAKVSYEEIIRLEEIITPKDDIYPYISWTGNYDVVKAQAFRRDDDVEDDRINVLMEMIKKGHDFSEHVWETEENEVISVSLDDESAVNDEASVNVEAAESDDDFQTPKGSKNVGSRSKRGKKRLPDRGMEKRKHKDGSETTFDVNYSEADDMGRGIGTQGVEGLSQTSYVPGFDPSQDKKEEDWWTPMTSVRGSVDNPVKKEKTEMNTAPPLLQWEKWCERKGHGLQLSDSPLPEDASPQASLYYISEESWKGFTEWALKPIPLTIGPTCFNLSVATRVVSAGKWLGNEEMDAVMFIWRVNTTLNRWAPRRVAFMSAMMAPRGRRTARGRGTATRVVREASPTNSVESVNGTNTETDGGSSTKGSQQSDQPAGYAEMMAELQRYRERFGDQMREESADGTPHQADARGYVPGVGVCHRHPPPPPPFVPAHVRGPTYWEVMKYMRDMQMDHFSGKASATSADNWRRKLEKNLDAARCPAEFRRELAVHYLKDEAMIWWEGVVELARGRYELTWEDFKDEFTREYVPPEATDKMENDFENLCQGNKTVKEYKEEFNRLRRFARRRMDEQDLIRRFMNGLRVDLKNRCSLRKYDRFAELVETAALQEIGLEEESKLTRSTQSKATKRTWEVANTPQTAKSEGGVTCHRSQLRNWAKLVVVLSSLSDPCSPFQTSDRSSVVACSPLPTVALPVPNVKLFASFSGFLTP